MGACVGGVQLQLQVQQLGWLGEDRRSLVFWSLAGRVLRQGEHQTWEWRSFRWATVVEMICRCR